MGVLYSVPHQSINPLFLQTEEQRSLFLKVIMSGLSQSDATYLCYVFPKMRQEKDLNGTELGNAAFMTTAASLTHLKRLAQKDFTIRSRHRAWNLGKNSL